MPNHGECTVGHSDEGYEAILTEWKSMQRLVESVGGDQSTVDRLNRDYNFDTRQLCPHWALSNVHTFPGYQPTR